MSLMRLALRAATVDALSNGGVAPFPTIAGPMIFDSKIDGLEHSATETMLPCVIVYTNRDLSHLPTKNQDNSFDQRQIELCMDLIIGTHVGDSFKYVDTDAEMEALLDLFEWQVWRTLNDPYSAKAKTWLKMVRSIDGWGSEPAREAKAANRLAMRQITALVRIKNDCLPAALMVRPGERVMVPNIEPLITVPYLSAMNDVLKSNPTFAVLREQLREARTGVPSRSIPAFEGVDMQIDTTEPA